MVYVLIHADDFVLEERQDGAWERWVGHAPECVCNIGSDYLAPFAARKAGIVLEPQSFFDTEGPLLTLLGFSLAFFVLFSTFGGGNRVIAVRGFAATAAAPEPGAGALVAVAALPVLGVLRAARRRRK